jgi:replicative DNA helicase
VGRAARPGAVRGWPVTDTPPPAACAAERLVLCGALKAPELVLPRLWDVGLCRAHFGWHCHGLVWDAVVALATTGRGEVGPHAVLLYLKARGQLADLGPRPACWLLELWGEDPTGAWAVPAAHEVVRAAARRAAIHRAREILRDAYAGCRETDYYRRAARAVG